MKLVRKSRQECEREATKVLTTSIQALLKRKEHVLIALPGGRSVSNIFTRLAEAALPWERIHIFLVDERLVPITSTESNYLLIKEHFLDKCTSFPDKNMHPFCVANTVDFGVSEYEAEVKHYGEHYDVLLLSAGEDAHIGGLFPNHETFDNDAPRFIWTKSSPKPPPMRMSMSRHHVLAAETAIILFFSAAKQEALKRFLDTTTAVRSCPAKLLCDKKETFVFTDAKP